MESYSVRIKASAVRELEAVPRKDRQRIVARIQTLCENPRPVGCEKLGGQDLYRVRQGNYRILYSVHDTHVLVVVIKIGHRREVY